MTHTIKDKTNSLEQAKQLRGQAETVEASLDKSVNYKGVMEVVVHARATIDELVAEVGKDHDEAHKIN